MIKCSKNLHLKKKGVYMATIMEKDILLEYASVGHLMSKNQTEQMKKDSQKMGMLYHKISTTKHENIDFLKTLDEIDEIRKKYENNKEDVFEQIWINEIENRNPYAKAEQINPQAFVLGGQPGAGKASLSMNIKNELKNDVIEINGDNFRKYHPLYKTFQNQDPLTMPENTAPFSAYITQNVLKRAIDKRYNVIIEGTFRTAQTPIDTLKLFKNNVYKTNVFIQTCHKDISWKSCQERYEKGKEVNPKEARHTDKNHHDMVVKKLEKNIQEVKNSGLADRVEIFTRDS